MVNQDRLSELITHRDDPCITITMPTAVKGPETQQGRIRLKNLVREAFDAVQDDQETSLRAWFESFIGDDEFWEHQRHGLMLLGSPNMREVWRMPFELPAEAHVADRFRLKHAIHVANSPAFELVAFSRGQVRVFGCDASHVEELEVDGLTKSFDDFMRFDDMEEQLQYHATSSPGASGTGRPDITHHGHGGGDDRRTADLERYATAVAKRMDERRARMKKPPMLVIAATTRDEAAYRSASEDRRLCEESIEGNHDRSTPDELREKGWEIAKERWQKEHDAARERIQVAMGADRSTATLNGVLAAAYQGRIDTLFAAVDVRRPGTFDPKTSKMTVSKEEGPRAGDLIDEAACVAMLHGADVHVVSSSSVPGDEGLVAAALRD